MMKNTGALKFFVFAAMLIGHGQLAAQHIHYSTLHGDCEDVETNSADCKEPSQCCHHHRRPSQQPDPMAEELFDDSSWPSRRDELSDMLMR